MLLLCLPFFLYRVRYAAYFNRIFLAFSNCAFEVSYGNVLEEELPLCLIFTKPTPFFSSSVPSCIVDTVSSVPCLGRPSPTPLWLGTPSSYRPPKHVPPTFPPPFPARAGSVRPTSPHFVQRHCKLGKFHPPGSMYSLSDAFLLNLLS